MEVKHVAIERDVLVQSPLTRAVVNHDVTDRIASERVFTVPYVCVAAAEAHVSDDYVMGVNLE